ncbi:pyridoxamine 5'-phosphate oxidase family protein [Streptomyces sp. NPDC005438]|uniref:pyridoxamine 5'-phosphate oxidase family protein n=1 Tax=Streptomyces sp. NPDC005438 TaxID=3156880 RepID=UPI0033B0ACB2
MTRDDPSAPSRPSAPRPPEAARPEPPEPSSAVVAFWAEPHHATFTTHRPDGSPHVVPVCSTWDPRAGIARVLASGDSRKVRNVLAAVDRDGLARVALCQVDGRRWATLEGRAVVRREPELIADAERRHEARYRRPPRPNPKRVLVEITVDRVLGRG